ncbi:MAG: hypothetical protein A2Z24_02515 [Candidatus Woykebacteria bacterium RBG_16_44_10]|uniref:DUF3800 domain-containing protein n=1 Tax=Candidatus Woykebacteria bacterium RBG_16_44_10 TaxID=1802597 RepID=A0A1G1WE66_9BACT|nr:MAG: hypothetical protein A2Z24_02515 [Candidatus Woykebacteria bacterium RBG_16_44_10]
MHFALIDESGRLADPKDRILVIAALVTRSLVGLDKIIPEARRKIPAKGKRRKELKLAEIKFSTTGDRTRERVLKLISSARVKVFILIIDKEGRKILDNPQNYAKLISKVLERAVKKFRDLGHVLIDRHFTYITQREKFNEILQKSLKRKLFIEHLDSQQNTIISLADFVAGAARFAAISKSSEFKKFIEGLIVSEERLTWRELAKQKGKSLKECP